MNIGLSATASPKTVEEFCRIYGSSKKTNGDHTGAIWIKVDGELVRIDTK